MKFRPLVLDVGRDEMEDSLFAKFPVFVALVDGECAGYVVWRIESEVVRVESIFTKEEYRLQGVATALHRKAEKIAASYGNDTVYNLGWKWIELRTWAREYRGWILICATKAINKFERES